MSDNMSNMGIFNPEYEANKNNWQMVRDLIRGEKALKDHDLSNVNQYFVNSVSSVISSVNLKRSLVYLPYTSTEYTTENLNRYCTYVQRASLFNATRRTEAGMSGMVYSKESKVMLPPSLEYLGEDADGTGVGILSQSVELLNDLLEVGRAGLFVDYPTIDASELSKADVELLNIRSSIIKYKAEDIVDWSVTSYGASQKLSFVKLREEYSCRDVDNIFQCVTACRYRVLLLNENGVYEQRIYTSDDNYESFIPTDNTGTPFTFIPFFFVGAVDNRPDCDIAPLLEIAELNIKHYRNSADYEESTFLVGQPMVGIVGLSQQWVDDNFPNGILFGSRTVMMLPEGADIKIVQADANTMAMSGMVAKEAQMRALGARLITDGGGVETAAAARIRHAADISVLHTLVANMNDAYESSIMAVQLYNGSVDDFEFEINDDFFVDSLDSAKISSLIQLWQSGIIDQNTILSAIEEMDVKISTENKIVQVDNTDSATGTEE